MPWGERDGGRQVRRTVATMVDLTAFMKEHAVDEVECLVPDMSGIARGKIVPARKYLKSIADGSLRIPESIFAQTVTGEFPSTEVVIDPADIDVYLRPDADTVRLVPWYEEPTALVIHDCFYGDGSPVEIAPRQVLRRVLQLYDERGWRPVVAPELEFYLVQINADPDYPLEPPIGPKTGRPEAGRQAYGVDAVNEFDPLFEDVYDYCEAQGIDIDTLIHESGAAQMEINFNHGAPMALADQVFLFKRTVRQVALKHNVYATFMAKPMEDQPGSSMHIHQSVVDKRTGRNLFATKTGRDTRLFRAHVGGLQRYLPAVMPLLAPHVNSYRRLQPDSSAPINVHWGHDNRTVGLRVPRSGAEARRIENRVGGADANPYLAIAGSLACGYLGMVENRLPKTQPIEGSAYRMAFTLPRLLPEALDKLEYSKPLKQVLGEPFVKALVNVKWFEYESYQQVISPWEREHLLLNV
jgi:glutamine synthetase